jgi:hypothetical protein
MFSPTIPSTIYKTLEIHPYLEAGEVVLRYLTACADRINTLNNTDWQVKMKIDRMPVDDNLQYLINEGGINCLVTYMYDQNNPLNYQCNGGGEFVFILTYNMVNEANNHHNIVQSSIFLRNLITKSIIANSNVDNYFSFSLPNNKTIKMYPFRNKVLSESVTSRDVNEKLLVTYIQTISFFLTLS